MTYLLMAALAAMAFAWLCRPLLSRAGTSPAARRAANVAAYETRLAEIAAETTAGLITEAEATALKQELAVRLLTDAGAASPAPGAVAPPRMVFTGLFAFVCAAVAAGWYWQAGTWRTAAQVAAAPPAAAASPTVAAVEAPTGAPDVDQMVAQLEKKLAAEPANAEGWAMLGRSYTVMQRYRESAEAFAKANALTGADANPEWLTGEGEALGLARERDLLGRPAQLFEAALKIDPGYNKALWYGALAAEQGGDAALAKARYTTLLKGELPDEIRTAVQAKLGGVEGAAPPAAVAAAEPETPAQPVAAGAISLPVTVQIAPALAAQVPANAVLFVFAKAASGPPMPLAVQRLPAAKLPLSLTLDDSMGMLPSLKLSQFDRWVITARYSGSGTVTAASGDLQGSITVGKAELGQPLSITIDTRLP